MKMLPQPLREKFDAASSALFALETALSPSTSDYDRRTVYHLRCGLADVQNRLRAIADPSTVFECRCCGVFVGGKTDGSFDAPGWGRIDGIDGPDAICPRCQADPTALDGWRDEYPDVAVRGVPRG